MPWFKVDDGLAFHPKFLAIGLAPAGLWVRSAAWVAHHLTDGFVPAGIPAALGATTSEIDALVAARLWEVTNGGWRFHDWHDFQPSREDAEEQRRKRAEAGRKGGQVSGKVRRGRAAAKHTPSNEEASASPGGSNDEAESNPVPVPVPVPVPSAAAAAEAAHARGEQPPPPLEQPELPMDVEILRTALDAARLVVRWDKLTADQVATISALVAKHGDKRLVKAAVQAWRPDAPAAYAQAWLGVWQALPDPGKTLAVVKGPRCTEYGHEREDASTCRLCAADRKAVQ
ncbi:hypothetical protein [Kineococcus terrestris]|uniref:hypothetical protein n=1 Tax=Kineococcus terrestris TaxID=2044856 RepID=UPI0034DB72C0